MKSHISALKIRYTMVIVYKWRMGQEPAHCLMQGDGSKWISIQFSTDRKRLP